MLEKISAVTTDKHGNIYIIHRPSHGDPIIVLDAQGTFIRSWGNGMFTMPHGISIDPGGNVWTLDAGHFSGGCRVRVQVALVAPSVRRAIYVGR
jgi:hypothetical protein